MIVSIANALLEPMLKKGEKFLIPQDEFEVWRLWLCLINTTKLLRP